MSGLEGLVNSNWLFFALLFAAIIAYMAVVRHRESKRISEKFDPDRIIITSFGVNYFGLESEPGGPLRSSGALVLLRDGLYYRSRRARRELFILGSAITYIGVADTHKGKSLHQSVVVIQFLNEEGRREKAAFRIPHPAQWVQAIKVNLLGREFKERSGK